MSAALGIKPPALPMLVMLIVTLPGCGLQRHAAESAVIEVQSDYALIRDQVVSIAPDEGLAIEAAIASAKASLEGDDAGAALRTARDLKATIHVLSERLPDLRTDLESDWNALSESLPLTLGSLRHELSTIHSSQDPRRRTALEEARRALPDLADQWHEAQLAREDGRLAEAVKKAHDVTTRAAALVTTTHAGS